MTESKAIFTMKESPKRQDALLWKSSTVNGLSNGLKKFPPGGNQSAEKCQNYFFDWITLIKLMIWAAGTVRTVSDNKVKNCQHPMGVPKM